MSITEQSGGHYRTEIDPTHVGRNWERYRGIFANNFSVTVVLLCYKADCGNGQTVVKGGLW